VKELTVERDGVPSGNSWPVVPVDAARVGLGVGMDLPWGTPIGFDHRTGSVTTRVQNFLQHNIDDFSYLFFAFQPRGVWALETDVYVPAFRRLRALLPADLPWALHHTILNLGTVQEYERDRVYDFTNRLIELFDFSWVVEDIGIWSLNGLPLPYPLPPYLTKEALEIVVRNVREARERLTVPLHVEFPGVTDGVSVVVGDMDAYEYFRRLADEADAWVTFDVGHLLAWRWLIGYRGDDLYENLDMLPLERCRELHLSGCAISRGRFLDLHHGVLMDEQIRLCEILLDKCPNLAGITYEDPKYGDDGILVQKSVPNYVRLREMASQWKQH
jgi:uncharacterized protein